MASKTLPIIFCSILYLLHFHFSEGQNIHKMAYWFGGSGMPVSGIESTHFTHLFCAFADLNPNTNQVTINPTNAPQFSSFTSTVQKKNPSIKTLLSIGGGNANKSAYAAMARNPSSRKSFIDSSIRLARSNGFHGLDLDWEYPETAPDMANFGLLLNEWKAAVAAEARNSGKPELLLAAAVFHSPEYYSAAVKYPIKAIANSLNWINVMTYDFYGPGWSKVTGPPAALRDSQNRPSTSKGISEWMQAGLPAKKIALGVPFYGYAWTLADPNKNGYNAPTTGAALTKDGAVTYKQIKDFIARTRAKTVHDDTVLGDYAYSDKTWIGYDDTQTIAMKISYARKIGLLGYFAWHVGADNNWALSSQASRSGGP